MKTRYSHSAHSMWIVVLAMEVRPDPSAQAVQTNALYVSLSRCGLCTWWQPVHPCTMIMNLLGDGVLPRGKEEEAC